MGGSPAIWEQFPNLTVFFIEGFPYVYLKCKIYKMSFHSRSIGMTFLHCEFVYSMLNGQVEKMPWDRGSNGKGFLLYECKCPIPSLQNLNGFGHREQ